MGVNQNARCHIEGGDGLKRDRLSRTATHSHAPLFYRFRSVSLACKSFGPILSVLIANFSKEHFGHFKSMIGGEFAKGRRHIVGPRHICDFHRL